MLTYINTHIHICMHAYIQTHVYLPVQYKIGMHFSVVLFDTSSPCVRAVMNQKWKEFGCLDDYSLLRLPPIATPFSQHPHLVWLPVRPSQNPLQLRRNTYKTNRQTMAYRYILNSTPASNSNTLFPAFRLSMAASKNHLQLQGNKHIKPFNVLYNTLNLLSREHTIYESIKFCLQPGPPSTTIPNYGNRLKDVDSVHFL